MMDDIETQQPSASPEEQPAAEPDRDRRGRAIVAIGFFLFFMLLWLAIHYLAEALTTGRHTDTGRPQFRVVQIPSGADVPDIADTLISHGVLKNRLVFKLAATIRRSTRDLKAGEYRFSTRMSPIDVLARLEQGRVMLHRFTIPEGYTIRATAERLEELELADRDEFIKLAEDPDFCAELGVGGPNLEGFLFPDTYKVARGLATRTLIRILVDRFWSVWLEELESEADADVANVREIVTIASIIEKEALYDDEKPLIGGVIYNRLKRNMRLQCDVTICYALDSYGRPLTNADLHFESPFNTYLLLGLPPTPICSPGGAAIRAALHPADTEYFYFVSMNNGRHKFSATLSEHNEAVYKYQVLNERG
jgi:UPF0755 protein